jgi:hypothetical protein
MARKFPMSSPETSEIAVPAFPVADVDAPGGDVGCDQDAQLTRLDERHRPLARHLREVAGDLIRVEALALQVRGDVAHVALGVAEDERALRHLVFEQADEIGVLLLRRRHDVVVLDFAGADLALREGHELRIVQEDARQRSHPFGNRGREQTGLPLLGNVLVDLAHVGPEAQREQLVRLVEHEPLHPVEHQAARTQMIEDASGRADDDVRALRETLVLRAVTHAAVDRKAADAAVLPHRLDLARDLVGELAGR